MSQILSKPRKQTKGLVTVQYLRNKVVWPIISKFVRLTETDEHGYGNCITCGKRYHFSELQAGHFNPGRFNSIIFDLRGIHIQCYNCNINLKGNPRNYDAYMKRTLGQQVIDDLDARAKKVEQFDRMQLLMMVTEYKPKVDTLLAGKIKRES